MHLEPIYVTVRLKTDRVNPVYSPNFVAGGIMTFLVITYLWFKGNKCVESHEAQNNHLRFCYTLTSFSLYNLHSKRVVKTKWS